MNVYVLSYEVYVYTNIIHTKNDIYIYIYIHDSGIKGNFSNDVCIKDIFYPLPQDGYLCHLRQQFGVSRNINKYA